MSPLVKSNWKTHCLGRHLVDAPADAKVRATFKYNDDPIELVPGVFDNASFKKAIDSREMELTAKKHDTRSKMFIERQSQGADLITLISWVSASSERGYLFETYYLLARTGRAYRYSGQVSASRMQTAMENRLSVGRSLHSIANADIPSQQGFVLDGAILQQSLLNTESFSAAIWLAGKPDVHLSISAFVQGKVEPGLLERAGGFLPGLLSVAGGIKTLRKGKHPVGPIYGEEILTAGTENGKRLYAFKWEAPGKANSLAEPNINVSLGVVESQYETNAESFASDEEALELWDAIVDSIRLRPGAV